MVARPKQRRRYGFKQCAAVTIIVDDINEPPQKKIPAWYNPTVQLHDSSATASPPMIRDRTADDDEHPHGAVRSHAYVVSAPLLIVPHTSTTSKPACKSIMIDVTNAVASVTF